MKILIGCLLVAMTLLNADNRNIYNELGISVGATSIKNESSSKFNNMGGSVTYQMSRYVVSPRFDLDYVNISDYDGVNSLVKASVNGVYEVETETKFLPYGLVGIGYENVSSEVKGEFESHLFVQGGAGVAYKLPDGYKARVEGKMLQILGGDDENNEMIVNVGVSFPINSKPEKKRRVVRQVYRPRQAVKPVIIRQQVPVPVYVNSKECSIKISAPDRDRDGIEDRRDQCPNTPCDFSVDGYGCPVKTTMKINFSTASSMIEFGSIRKVQNFANFLLSHRGSMVKIVGYTDSVGKKAYNLALSKRRAKSVADKLIDFGVSPARISHHGMGESNPVASNKTAWGKAENRRIEAILSYPNSRRR